MKHITAIMFLLLAGASITAQNLQKENYLLPDTTAEQSLKKRHLLKKAALSIGYAALTYYCYKEEDNHFQKESQEQHNAFNTQVSKMVSPLGLGKTNWIALGATSAFSYIIGDKKLQQTIYIWAGSLAINDFGTNQLKLSFQRHRPYTQAPFNTFDWRIGPRIHKSLPSFHTSTAFATATVLATMYKEKKWVGPLAYGLATMVGTSRVYDNAHWASDVMAGAAVGFASAKLMIFLDKELSKKGIRIYPLVGKQSSIVLLYTFDK